MIQLQLNGNKYQTQKLTFEDLQTLGFSIEEKIIPFFACFATAMANGVKDGEILQAIYKSCKDALNPSEWKELCEIVRNDNCLLINGKKLEGSEWHKHWQEVGFADYRVMCLYFIKENLGNFMSLSALIPNELTEKVKSQMSVKLEDLLLKINSQLDNSENNQEK